MIYIAGDRHGEEALTVVRDLLVRSKIAFEDLGYCGGARPGIRLPELIVSVVSRVRSVDGSTGILACGTGAGVEIGANRFARIRASLCGSVQAAEWARVYDNANVLCLAAWSAADLDIAAILSKWLQSEYDGSPSRLAMLEEFDRWAGDDR